MSSKSTLYPAAAVGYRIWHLSGRPKRLLLPRHPNVEAVLRSIGVGTYDWVPGINAARCRYRPHPAPSGSCFCGLYSYHDLEEAHLRACKSAAIAGAVLCAGQVEVHHNGIRAERAAVCGLLEPWDSSQRRLAKTAAERYQVPLFETLVELRAYAQTLGISVPERERPGPPQPEPRFIRSPQNAASKEHDRALIHASLTNRPWFTPDRYT